MGDDEVKSTRSRFLSRMQRSKSTKDDSTRDSSKRDESLNKDVVDFLKPSTDRAALLRPRIDVAIAQRWPEAQHVDNPDALPAFETPDNVNGMRKRRRREGLAVSFAPTAPEIVGEGGDECPYPTIEISKAKAQGRPALTPQRRSADHSRAWAAPPGYENKQPELSNVEQGSPRPLRRANTTHYDQGSGTRHDDQRFTGLGAERNSGSGTPLSQHDRKRTLMTASEGMALRRASSIPNFDDHDDENNDNEIDDHDDPPPHFGPGSGQKNFSMPLRSPTLPQLAPRSPVRIAPAQSNERIDDGLSRVRPPPTHVPDSSQPERPIPAAVQLDLPDRGTAASRSPFDDPKYNQRRANGAVAAPRPPPQSAVPTLPQVSLPELQTAYPGQPQYAALSRAGLESRSSRDLNSEAKDVSGADYTPFRPQRSRTNTLTGPLSPPSARRQQSGEPALSNPVSAQPSPISPSTKEAALADFANRVSYMMRRFELYVQVEAKPQGLIDQSSPAAWLRAAYWWYLNGKMGLEAEVRARQQSRSFEHRELLLQGHVDLAKAWWIISSQLEGLESSPGELSASPLHADYAELHSCIQALCLSLGRNDILPPSAALIQHQDSRIWLGHFSTIRSSYLESLQGLPPSRILPVGDTPSQFYYSRFTVKVSMTSKQGVDESTIPCLLTVVRGIRSYQTEAVIASQDNLISVRIASAEAQALSWRSVTWIASRCALSVPLPDSTMLHLRMQDQDYRALGNMVEYSRNAMKTMQPARNEALSYQAQLSALQYSTTASTSPFPRGQLKHCRVLLIAARDTGIRRLVLATEPSVKILSCVSHQETGPGHIVEEGQAADASTTVELLFRDERKQSQAVLDFRDEADLKKFQAVRKGEQQPSSGALAANDLVQSPNASVTIPLTYFDIRSANDISQQHQSAGPASAFGWKYLALSNDKEEATRFTMRHSYGHFVDQLDSKAGELYIRLPTGIDNPSIEVHRDPQDSFDAALDPKQCPQSVGSMTSMMVQAARQQSTLRTYVFPSLQALHDFQQQITGLTVRFDGIASTLAISRRMMVVPIHHKWTANDVRLQVISNPSGSVVKLLAFMQGFDHAEAMCFQVKSTDVFEKIKGDSKHKKWALKLVDAKFSLYKPAKGEEAHISALRRQFISLEGLEYAEEHDDITVGFDSEEVRELFGNALPAATTTPKLISLRRRI